MLKIRIEIVMLVFFDVIRIVMVEYVPSKQGVNQQLCIQILTKLQARIKKKKYKICGIVVGCCNKAKRYSTKRCGPSVFN